MHKFVSLRVKFGSVCVCVCVHVYLFSKVLFNVDFKIMHESFLLFEVLSSRLFGISASF